MSEILCNFKKEIREKEKALEIQSEIVNKLEDDEKKAKTELKSLSEQTSLVQKYTETIEYFDGIVNTIANNLRNEKDFVVDLMDSKKRLELINIKELSKNLMKKHMESVDGLQKKSYEIHDKFIQAKFKCDHLRNEIEEMENELITTKNVLAKLEKIKAYTVVSFKDKVCDNCGFFIDESGAKKHCRYLKIKFPGMKFYVASSQYLDFDPDVFYFKFGRKLDYNSDDYDSENSLIDSDSDNNDNGSDYYDY